MPPFKGEVNTIHGTYSELAHGQQDCTLVEETSIHHPTDDEHFRWCKQKPFGQMTLSG